MPITTSSSPQQDMLYLTRMRPPKGQPANPAFDRAKDDIIAKYGSMETFSARLGAELAPAAGSGPGKRLAAPAPSSPSPEPDRTSLDQSARFATTLPPPPIQSPLSTVSADRPPPQAAPLQRPPIREARIRSPQAEPAPRSFHAQILEQIRRAPADPPTPSPMVEPDIDLRGQQVLFQIAQMLQQGAVAEAWRELGRNALAISQATHSHAQGMIQQTMHLIRATEDQKSQDDISGAGIYDAASPLQGTPPARGPASATVDYPPAPDASPDAPDTENTPQVKEGNPEPAATGGPGFAALEAESPEVLEAEIDGIMRSILSGREFSDEEEEVFQIPREAPRQEGAAGAAPGEEASGADQAPYTNGGERSGAGDPRNCAVDAEGGDPAVQGSPGLGISAFLDREKMNGANDVTGGEQ